MKTDSHQPSDGRERGQTDDNVVRLPREWLGPREDLVQIGVPDEAPGAPPAPEDFWGEGSSELQSALVGSPEIPPTTGPRAAPPNHPPRLRLSRPWPARTLAVLVAASTALILAVVVISALGGQRPGPLRPQIASLSHSRDVATGGTVLQTASRHLSQKRTRARRAHDLSHRHSRATHRRPPKGRGAAPGTSVSPTLIASSSTPGSSAAYSSSSSASSTASQTASSGAAQAASAQSSEPAFGQNGSLGPGRGAPNTQ